MSFTVTIHSTGECFRVEEGESVLHAARRHGIDLPCGCHSGVCGACISRIISGRLFYPGGQPMALFGEDRDKGLCCVGFPRGNLVIEPQHLGEDCEAWI
jgi:ferredoxin